jgi:hypothetical protein
MVKIVDNSDFVAKQWAKPFTALEPDAHYNFFSKINVEA